MFEEPQPPVFDVVVLAMEYFFPPRFVHDSRDVFIRWKCTTSCCRLSLVYHKRFSHTCMNIEYNLLAANSFVSKDFINAIDMQRKWEVDLLNLSMQNLLSDWMLIRQTRQYFCWRCSQKHEKKIATRQTVLSLLMLALTILSQWLGHFEMTTTTKLKN